MDNLQKLTQEIIKFRNARDWKQFHNPKDMAISLSLESSELLEHFQWKSIADIKRYVKTNKEEVGEELADILNWILLISHDLEIDIVKAMQKKLKKNAEKYPVEKSKGTATKYTKL